jgi:hypothetical protein
MELYFETGKMKNSILKFQRYQKKIEGFSSKALMLTLNGLVLLLNFWFAKLMNIENKFQQKN